MTTPRRYQTQAGRRRNRKQLPDDCIFVGKPTIFKLPFSLNIYSWPEALENYRKMIDGTLDSSDLKESDDSGQRLGYYKHLGQQIAARLPLLKGHPLSSRERLGEFSHADILIELANPITTNA